MIIDHFCLAARNLYSSAARLRQATGLDSYDGGWMPGSGLGMRVVPLPARDQYVEVVSVIDHEVAQGVEYGRWFWDVSRGDALVGWTVRVDSLEELQLVADRLLLPVVHRPLVRLLPDGAAITLSVAGDTNALWRRGLPNFICWHDAAEHPGRRPIEHRCSPGAIRWLELGGNQATVSAWLGEGAETLPLRFVGGRPGLRAAAIATGDDEIVIRPGVVPSPEVLREFDWRAGATIGDGKRLVSDPLNAEPER